MFMGYVKEFVIGTLVKNNQYVRSKRVEFEIKIS